MTHDLDKLLNWRLLRGSHKFPGPEGGTCINEAAVVVAGFPYRRVWRADDLPTCFSRPIATYAIALNDRMNNRNRQRLIPFVVRLAGSADSIAVETQRAELIVLRTLREIVALALDRSLAEAAMNLRHATADNMVNVTSDAYRAALSADRKTTPAALSAPAAAKLAAEAHAAARSAVAERENAASADKEMFLAVTAAAAAAARAVIAGPRAQREHIWTIQISIFDEALTIGNKAEPLEHALIAERVTAAKRAVLASAA